MNEIELQRSLGRLHLHSRTSLLLVVLGALFLGFSVYYSASRLTPLEREISAKQEAIEKLRAEEVEQRAKVAELNATFSILKASTESLYSVRVTPANNVYELKATAIATGKKSSANKPEYKFTLLINSPPSTLNEIQKVTYRMEHETFQEKDYVATDAKNQFARSYVGWGCLSQVKVSVALKSGVVQEFDFNMCRSLGPQWGG